MYKYNVDKEREKYDNSEEFYYDESYKTNLKC